MGTKEVGPAIAPAQDVIESPGTMPAPIAHQVAESAGMQLVRMAIARGASLEEIDRLIQLKDRMDAEDARKAFVSAMVEFKRNPPTIIKNKTGTVRPKDESKGGFSYGYADLAAVCQGVIEALASVGISHSWTTKQDQNMLAVTCTLTHELGHSASTTLAAGYDSSGGKNAIQGIGSTRTYLCRYTLLTITGIAVDDGTDDDGAGVTGGDRAELRSLAQDVRGGRKGPSPAELVGRNQVPAGEKLLQEARAVADKGHQAFGLYWRELGDGPRGQLLSELENLTERANAATAQRAQESGGK